MQNPKHFSLSLNNKIYLSKQEFYKNKIISKNSKNAQLHPKQYVSLVLIANREEL